MIGNNINTKLNTKKKKESVLCLVCKVSLCLWQWLILSSFFMFCLFLWCITCLESTCFPSAFCDILFNKCTYIAEPCDLFSWQSWILHSDPEGVRGNKVTVSVWFPNETDENSWDTDGPQVWPNHPRVWLTHVEAWDRPGWPTPQWFMERVMKESEIRDLNDGIYN